MGSENFSSAPKWVVKISNLPLKFLEMEVGFPFVNENVARKREFSNSPKFG